MRPCRGVPSRASTDRFQAVRGVHCRPNAAMNRNLSTDVVFSALRFPPPTLPFVGARLDEAYAEPVALAPSDNRVLVALSVNGDVSTRIRRPDDPA